MKTLNNPTLFILFLGILICGDFFFQSCNPVDDVKPIGTPGYLVTVKVIDVGQNGGTIVASNAAVKHFRITTTGAMAKTVLDTNITGSYSYSFSSPTPNLTVTAGLNSATSFTNAIEIDANGKMEAYHGGSCAGTEYDVTDNINF